MPPPTATNRQANKNVLLKARLGSDGAAVLAAFKSWFQPSLALAGESHRRLLYGMHGGYHMDSEPVVCSHATSLSPAWRLRVSHIGAHRTDQ